MDKINEYFDGLIFTNVEIKETHTIYAAKIVSSYANNQQMFILAMVPSHLAINKTAYIRDLPWECIQTRLLNKYLKLKEQTWKPSVNIQTFIFNNVKRDPGYSTYASNDIPFELLLIHDPRKKSVYQYYDKMNLLASFNTWRSVLTYTGKTHPLLAMEDDSFELV